MLKEKIKNNDLILNLTSSVCPEQYDVYIKINNNKINIGYIRLRHGYLTTDFIFSEIEKILNINLHPEDEIEIYEKVFDEDFKGGFDNDKERDFYLSEIKNKIVEKFNQLYVK